MQTCYELFHLYRTHHAKSQHIFSRSSNGTDFDLFCRKQNSSQFINVESIMYRHIKTITFTIEFEFVYFHMKVSLTWALLHSRINENHLRWSCDLVTADCSLCAAMLVSRTRQNVNYTEPEFSSNVSKSSLIVHPVTWTSVWWGHCMLVLIKLHYWYHELL